MRQRGEGAGEGEGEGEQLYSNKSLSLKKKKKSIIWFKDQIMFTASVLYNEKNIGVEPAINCGLSLMACLDGREKEGEWRGVE